MAPSHSSQLQSYHAMLHSRRRGLRNLAGMWLGLAAMAFLAGYEICSWLAHARAAAGKSFARIDQASDYLFLGILLGVVFLVISGITWGRWVLLGDLQKRHRWPIPGVNVSSPPEEA